LPNGNLVSGGFGNNLLNIWKPNDFFCFDECKSYSAEFSKSINSNSETSFLTVLPSGYLAATGLNENGINTIKIWNTDNSSLVMELKGHTNKILAMVVLPNGNLASASHDKTIRIWDLKNGSLLRTLTDHPFQVLSLAVLQNGYLVSGSNSLVVIHDQNLNFVRKIVLWNNIKTIADLNNGALAISGDEKALMIYNIDTGKEVKLITSLDSIVTRLVVLQNGYLAASGYQKITIWDRNTWRKVKEINADDGYINHLMTYRNCFLVSGGDDQKVKVWNINDYSLVASFTGQNTNVTSLETLPNGNLVSGGFGNNLLNIWKPN